MKICGPGTKHKYGYSLNFHNQYTERKRRVSSGREKNVAIQGKLEV
jgi:hypothetical protein